MNTLEKLTAEDKGNYEVYLNRMSQSCAVSSKHLIPFYTIGKKTILDVGCADGTLMKAIKEVNPEARAVGIDLNQNAIDLARAAGLEAYKLSLEDVAFLCKDQFDCVVFSSVLHEISSYATANRFSALPIQETLESAYDLLSKDGIIIIRDGLMDNSEEICTAKFANPDDEKWFFKFVNEFEYPYFDYDYHDMKGAITCYTELMQEFLATWTWGEKSWHREIQEKFCILTEQSWMKVVNGVGFEDIAFFKSKEDYPKFLIPKVKLYGKHNREFFPYMTCTIVAKKNS